MTSTGIEPAIFRFVAQYLNHCATVPQNCKFNKIHEHQAFVLPPGKIRSLAANKTKDVQK
jgi:hypothetical protein